MGPQSLSRIGTGREGLGGNQGRDLGVGLEEGAAVSFYSGDGRKVEEVEWLWDSHLTYTHTLSHYRAQKHSICAVFNVEVWYP